MAPRPSIIKRKNKKVQLNRIQSLADLSRTGQGYDYGLSESDYSQPKESELKITSIRVGCSDLHFKENCPDEQGCKEEPTPTVSSARDRLFEEMEKTDQFFFT